MSYSPLTSGACHFSLLQAWQSSGQAWQSDGSVLTYFVFEFPVLKSMIAHCGGDSGQSVEIRIQMAIVAWVLRCLGIIILNLRQRTVILVEWSLICVSYV